MAAPKHPLPLLVFALTAVWLAPAPSFADGVEEPKPPPVAAPPPVVRDNAPAACVGEAPLGQVVAVSGDVHVGAPGQAPRALACDDGLGACEELVTGPGASLAFLSGDVLVRVGGGSRVALAGSEGAPNLFVHQGSVRTTDARPAGAAPVRLTSRDLAASASGADAELSAGSGPSRLCTYDGSAAVVAGASSRTLGAGQCLAAERGGVAGLAAAGDPAHGLEAPGFCAYEVALDDSLTPGDVAAPPLDVFPGGDPAADVPRDPCDEPGAGCNPKGAGFRFDDPDPVPGCGAPGVDCDGGKGGGGKPGKGKP